MKRNKVRAIALMMGFGLIATMSSPANAATAQKINYYINGDCSDYYDEQGEYAFFESEPDWNCYISVYVKPSSHIATFVFNSGLAQSGFRSHHQQQIRQERDIWTLIHIAQMAHTATANINIE